MRVLIVYASTHGHTAKIAERIADAMRAAGADVDVQTAHDAAGARPHDYDAVVVGASVHGGHHQREVVAWAEHHRTSLSRLPSAFFSVCLAAAEDTAESREATRGYRDDFEERTGWTPARSATFAGALQYREYDFPTRLVMRLLMHRGQHPTDVSRDYEYTDWAAVDRFAHDLALTWTAAARRAGAARAA